VLLVLAEAEPALGQLGGRGHHAWAAVPFRQYLLVVETLLAVFVHLLDLVRKTHATAARLAMIKQYLILLFHYNTGW